MKVFVTRNRAVAIAVALATAGLSGCSVSLSRCEYVQFHEQVGLRIVTEARGGGGCWRVFKPVPLHYELSRENYTIGIAQGEPHHPLLALEAVDRERLGLTLQGSGIKFSIDGASQRPMPIKIRGISYRYFALPRELSANTLVLEVRARDGSVLGTERLRFTIGHGRKWILDAL